MLYDEPTTGLDPITSKEISSLINDLQHSLKMTSIVVTHDLLCAKIIADRAIVLDEGLIVKEGNISELTSSDEPLLKNFFSDEIILPARLTAEPGTGQTGENHGSKL